MIIVEGCDNTGKSTLVSRLADEVKLLSVANKRKPTTTDDAFTFLNSMIALSRRFPTIFDRWSFISETVYGPVIRGRCLFTPYTIEVARAAPVLAELRPLIIYCRPQIRNVETTIWERPQMKGVAGNIEKLMDAYDDVIDHWQHAKTNPYPVVRYNYRDPIAYEYVLERVRNHFEERFDA